MTEIEHLVEALSANDELSQVQVIGILAAGGLLTRQKVGGAAMSNNTTPGRNTGEQEAG